LPPAAEAAPGGEVAGDATVGTENRRTGPDLAEPGRRGAPRNVDCGWPGARRLESTLPLITNDAVVLGILMGILAAVFTTSRSSHPFWKKLYTFVPPLLLCYFLPSVVSTLGVISGEHSQLYFVSSRYLLPTSLVLLTLSVDFGGIVRLGPKAGIMFLVGTLGILLGGPIAILVVSAVDPEVVGGQGADAVWGGGELDRRRCQPDRDEGDLRGRGRHLLGDDRGRHPARGSVAGGAALRGDARAVD
jgi:hypothetical protein